MEKLISIFQNTLPKVLNNFSNSYLLYTLELLLIFLIVFFVLGLLIRNNGAGILAIFIVYVICISAICLLLETEPIMY